MNKQQAQEIVDLLENIKELQNVNKIITTFIPPFSKKSIKRKDSYFLNGSFNVGVKSGRLSSAQPNLQQLPSTGTKYAKPIKKCFQPPPGWLLVGADYSSLEDRISALQTKDPNKLKVYTDGYDGHCLRAYAYFHDQMPDIQLASPEERCYIAKVGGTDIHFRASDTLEYEGKTYTGEEFYEAFIHKRL